MVKKSRAGFRVAWNLYTGEGRLFQRVTST